MLKVKNQNLSEQERWARAENIVKTVKGFQFPYDGNVEEITWNEYLLIEHYEQKDENLAEQIEHLTLTIDKEINNSFFVEALLESLETQFSNSTIENHKFFHDEMFTRKKMMHLIDKVQNNQQFLEEICETVNSWSR
jgi:hypothetical protein